MSPKENIQLLNFTDLEDGRFYCFYLNVPAIMKYTAVIGIQEILQCGFLSTFPKVGTVTELFKKCLNATVWGRMYFDSVMSVHEGVCECFAGFSDVSVEVNYHDYNTTLVATPYAETLFTPTDETEIRHSPSTASGTSLGLHRGTELATGFADKSEFSTSPEAENEISHKPTSKVFLSSTKNDITVSKDPMDETVTIDNETSIYSSDSLILSPVCSKCVIVLFVCSVLYVIF